MILSTHFIAGAAVASYTESPTLIIVVPIIIHLLLDCIPHWEYINKFDDLKKRIPILIADMIAGPLVISLAVASYYGIDLEKIFWFFAAGFFGVFMDGLTFLYLFLPKNKVLKNVFLFHDYIQPKSISPVVGLAFQFTLDILAIALIVLPKA